MLTSLENLKYKAASTNLHIQGERFGFSNWIVKSLINRYWKEWSYTGSLYSSHQTGACYALDFMFNTLRITESEAWKWLPQHFGQLDSFERMYNWGLKLHLTEFQSLWLAKKWSPYLINHRLREAIIDRKDFWAYVMWIRNNK